MAQNRVKPCWPTLIGTTIAVLAACCTTVGYLLNQWAAPKEEAFKGRLAIIELKAKGFEKDLEDVKIDMIYHKTSDSVKFEKIESSIDRYKSEAEKRDAENKELMTKIQIILGSLEVSTKYIEETVKELKYKINKED